MYAEDRHKSAKQRWNHANSKARIAMLKEAGFPGGMAHAYQAFDDLPTVMKLDLNFVAERENRKPADSSGEADAHVAGIESGAIYA
jgi:hypothetical protein